MLRELTIEERWELGEFDPRKLIPPQPDMRPVMDTVTKQIKYVRGELPKEQPCRV